MSGKVDVQSRALRSYKAVVMPTEALLTFGMLKLTSLMMGNGPRRGRRKVFRGEECDEGERRQGGQGECKGRIRQPQLCQSDMRRDYFGCRVVSIRCAQRTRR